MSCIKRFLNKFKIIKRHPWWSLAILNILVIALLSLIIGSVLSLSILTQDNLNQHQIAAKFYPLIRTLRKMSDIIYLPFYLVPSKLSTYELTIQPQDLEFLNQNLPQPYTDKVLTAQYKKEVPAKLYYNNQEYDVEVRYRGQHSNHWSADKKSWLIRLTSDKLLDGKKEMSLILPYDRSYGIEQLDNYRAQKLGVLAPASQFVKLKVNNKSMGVYFEIEGWTSEMVEKNNNLSGDTEIYTFDTSIYTELPSLSDITYWEKHIANPLDEEGYENLDKLIKITNYNSDEKFAQQIGNILDLNKFYAWQINYILMTAGHGEGPNLKLYFNKDTGKFEPIAWDVGQGPVREDIDYAFNLFSQKISTWPEFIRQRNQLLWDYVKDDKNLEDDLAYYDKIYNQIRYDLYRDRLKVKSNLQFDHESQQRIKQYADTYHQIQDSLKNKNAYINIQTNLAEHNTLAVIDFQVENFPSLKFYGLDFSLENSDIAQSFNLYDKQNNRLANFKYDVEADEFKATDFERILTAQRQVVQSNIKVVPTHFQFYIKSNASVKKLKIIDVDFRLKNYLSDKKADLKIKYLNQSIYRHFDKINLSAREFINIYPYFRYKNSNSVSLGPGDYYLTQTVVVPKNVVLTIYPNTKLFFNPDVSLVSYGRVIAQGSPGQPIIFTANNKSQPWGVVGIVNQDATDSIFDYCEFKYGSQAAINGIYFTGQLAVHNAQAIITNSKFSYAQADDSLNIKYGLESIVNNNNFFNNSSDAIDFDWTDGQIKNNYFYNNPGDAIDLSGSQTLIQDNQIETSGDKGISVGEKSEPLIVNNLIINNKIGIEVKDLSKAIIINNTLTNNETGINEYEKKQIFGPGQAEVYNSVIWNNNQQIRVSAGEVKISNSVVQGGWDGKDVIDVEPESDEVDKILDKEILKEYGVEEYGSLGFVPNF